MFLGYGLCMPVILSISVPGIRFGWVSKALNNKGFRGLFPGYGMVLRLETAVLVGVLDHKCS